MRPKIYYLDDEVELLELFSDLFVCDKYEIQTFSDVKAFLLKAQQEPADLYILDYRLPGTNGFEVAAQMPKDAKKILITGELNLDVPRNFICRLEKPFQIEEIQKLLLLHTRQKRATSAA